jgi:coenzyme F420-reducing hydrogenase gamma subunit
MKPKLSFEWLHACSGCEIALLNYGEPLLALLNRVEIVHFPLLMDHKYTRPEREDLPLSLPEADIGLVSGGVAHQEHLTVLHEMRRQCRTLIALGTCATHGGIPAMRNQWSTADTLQTVLAAGDTEPGPMLDEPSLFLDRVYSVDEKVPVEVSLPGCPPQPELIAAIRAPAHNAALFDCARPLRGTWEIDAGKREFRCTGEQGGALLLDLPGENPDYYVEAEIVLASPESGADVLVRTSEALDRGYRITAGAGADEIAIRQAKTGGGTFHKKEHPVVNGNPVKVKIFVCDSMMEVFVDDHLSLSTRIFDRSAHRVAIEITGGPATIRNPLLHYFKQGS